LLLYSICCQVSALKPIGPLVSGITTPAPIILDESHMFVRLVGRGNHNEGLVEVYANGVWGTICDDHWDSLDASVICDMLGFGKLVT